jgi:acyl-CoA synthetase (AMP-forming)/AMP-acid ligase II
MPHLRWLSVQLTGKPAVLGKRRLFVGARVRGSWRSPASVCSPAYSTSYSLEFVLFGRPLLNRLVYAPALTSVDFVAELPRNPAGKLLKNAIRQLYWAGTERNI